MRMLFAVLLLAGAPFCAMAAPAASVQDAIKMLPSDQAKNIVRIEAREGTPEPERWYIQVYDPEAENGLREFAITEKVIASRTISQFLDAAKPEDVVGEKLIKTDSSDLIKIARKYIEASKLDVAKINYTMLREGADSPPIWKLSCLDASGNKLAEIVINARTDDVVSHDGFERAPGEKPKPALVAEHSARPQPAVPVASAIPVAPADQAPTPRRGFFRKIFGAKTTASPVPENH